MEREQPADVPERPDPAVPARDADSAVPAWDADPAVPAWDADSAVPARDADSAVPVRPTARRSERSPKDMAISLLVLLVPILLFLAFYRVVLGGDQPVRVDPAPAIGEARAADAFPVAEPVGLGDSWRPVRANFQSADGFRTLRIGYVSPEGSGVQLVQSNVPAERLLPAELTRNGQAQGATEVAGRDWQRYSARAGQRALVLLQPERTVIVLGDAAEAELRDLAGALR